MFNPCLTPMPNVNPRLLYAKALRLLATGNNQKDLVELEKNLNALNPDSLYALLVSYYESLVTKADADIMVAERKLDDKQVQWQIEESKENGQDKCSLVGNFSCDSVILPENAIRDYVIVPNTCLHWANISQNTHWNLRAIYPDGACYPKDLPVYMQLFSAILIVQARQDLPKELKKPLVLIPALGTWNFKIFYLASNDRAVLEKERNRLLQTPQDMMIVMLILRIKQ